jgi:hypothetical protein
MPSETLQPHGGRPEQATDSTRILPTTCSVQELRCDGDPVKAAQKRVAEAERWQWQAEVKWDLCERRYATAALQHAREELEQVENHRT